MHRRGTSSGAKTPSLTKNRMPPLSRQRGQSETPTNTLSDLTTYSLIQDNSFNLNTVNKFFTPSGTSKTAVPSSFHLDTDLKEDSFSKPHTANFNWEIAERLETCSIRTKLSPSISASEEFSLWVQCAIDITPVIKRQHPGLAQAFLTISSKMSVLFKDFQKLNEENLKKSCMENAELMRRVKGLEEEAGKMTRVIEELRSNKRMEMEKIRKEINEIFGAEDMEGQLSKLKSKRFYDASGSGTAEYLKQIYDNMNKEYYIPESKAQELPIINFDEFNLLINSKFKEVQKNTATRVCKMLENNKSKASEYSQTTAVYVNPKDHEDLVALNEKVTLQYQSASMQLERFREDFLQKSSVCENLESEKLALLTEVGKYKREFEKIQKDPRAKKNLEFNRIEVMDKLKITSKFLNSDNEKLSSTEIASNKTIEQKDLIIKEKNERIKILEDKLERIRLKGYEKSEESEKVDKSFESFRSREKFVRSSAEEVKADTDKFEVMLNPIKPKDPKNIRHRNTALVHLSDSRSTLQDNYEDFLVETPSPGKGDSRSQVNQDFSSFSKTAASNIQEKFVKQSDPSLPTRVNSRDTPLERVDESKEIKNHSILRDFKDTTNRIPNKNDYKDSKELSNIGEYKDTAEFLRANEYKNLKDTKNISLKNKRNAQVRYSGEPDKSIPIQINKPTGNTLKYKHTSDSRNESEADEHENKSVQWGYNKSQLCSRESRRAAQFEVSEVKQIIGTNGLEYSVVDKGVWTTDELKFINLKNCSKAVQTNEVSPETSESRVNLNKNIYFLPYNPNNIYGLRGDMFFSSKQTFQAQPRIPDLANSVLFQSPYYLESEKPKESEQTSLYISKC